MKRKLIPTTALAVLLALGMVACGGNNPDDPGKKDDPTQDPVEVKITITAAGDKKKLVKGDTAETVQLTASETGVTWASSKPEVATVSADGLVTAVGKGSTVISAKKDGCKDGSISITVELEKITVTATKNKLVLEEETQLTASKTGVTWSSSDATVASVDASGKVKGLKYGTATIKAEKDGYDAGSVSITVDRPEPSAVLHFEDAEHYAANGVWGSTSSYYSSSSYTTPVYSKDQASDGTCLAHFRAGDKETLTFTASKACTAEVCITVGSSSAKEDLSACFTAKVNGTAADLTGVAYTPVDTSAYTFDPISLGNHNLKAGENKVEIEFVGSSNPYIDEIKIYCSDASAKFEIKKADPMKEFALTSELEVSIEEGKTSQITSAITGLSYKSSAEGKATVSETGLITAVAKGSANITVWKAGYTAVTVKVTVTEKVVDGEIRLEAEAATPSDAEKITFRTPSSGASGDITNAWEVGETLTFNITGATAGNYELYFTGRGNRGESYSYNDVNLASDVEIKVNDVVFAGEGTISGSSFVTVKVGVVTLKAGANTIAIKNVTLAPTLDYIKLVPEGAGGGTQGGGDPQPAGNLVIAIDTDKNGKLTTRPAKFEENNDAAKYEFTATPGTYKMYFYGGVDSNGNQNCGFRTGKNGTKSKVDPLPDNKRNMSVVLNGTSLALSDKTYKELSNDVVNGPMDTTTLANVGNIYVADVTLAASNVLDITRLDSYCPKIYDIVFVPYVAHTMATHVWTEATAPTQETGAATVKKYTCECGYVKYEIDVKTANFTLAEGSSWKTDPSSGNLKLKSDGHSASTSFKLDAGFTGQVYQVGYMDSYSSNYKKKLYYETDSVANVEAKVNGTAIDLSSQSAVTFQDVFGDGTGISNSEVKEVLIGDATFINGVNTFSFKRVKTLNLTVSKFIIVGKIA